MKKLIICSFAFALFMTTTSNAQPFELDIVAIHSGGSSGDPESEYSLSLTVGLSLAAPETSGTEYSVAYGLWNAIGIQTLCPADFTGDGILNFFDTSLFLSAFEAEDPAADMNNDGVFDFFDISSYLASYATGC